MAATFFPLRSVSARLLRDGVSFVREELGRGNLLRRRPALIGDGRSPIREKGKLEADEMSKESGVFGGSKCSQAGQHKEVDTDGRPDDSS